MESIGLRSKLIIYKPFLLHYNLDKSTLIASVNFASSYFSFAHHKCAESARNARCEIGRKLIFLSKLYYHCENWSYES